ncbi:MAG: ferritin family protein [Candidatus Omnitrophica bacterium]|jgi:rubrerythrin|nr:ferritin family protein [Candidatus Omnitrophota bacterium]
MEQIKNPYEFSLNFEIEGVNLYLKLARETKNILGKRLFYTLARQEIEHAQRFDEIYTLILEKKNIKEIKFENSNINKVEDEIKLFFTNVKKFSLKDNVEDTSSYDLAMEMEEKTIKVYTDFLQQSGKEEEKDFFRQLLKEENKHLEALKNVYSYLKSSGDWFKEDESKIWNWMNI